MSCHEYLDTDQVSSLSEMYNQKRHFISVRPEGRFYDFTYIELMFRKKSVFYTEGLCQNKQLEKCLNSSKNGQNPDFEPRFQGNYSTHNQIVDVYDN